MFVNSEPVRDAGLTGGSMMERAISTISMIEAIDGVSLSVAERVKCKGFVVFASTRAERAMEEVASAIPYDVPEPLASAVTTRAQQRLRGAGGPSQISPVTLRNSGLTEADGRCGHPQ